MIYKKVRNISFFPHLEGKDYLNKIYLFYKKNKKINFYYYLSITYGLVKQLFSSAKPNQLCKCDKKYLI